jgi:hypothetical protein
VPFGTPCGRHLAPYKRALSRDMLANMKLSQQSKRSRKTRGVRAALVLSLIVGTPGKLDKNFLGIPREPYGPTVRADQPDHRSSPQRR